MYKTQKILFITISILLFFLGMIWGISSLLDREAENILNNIYLKDAQGIIEGEGPIEVKRGGKEAFIFIHGFMAYPSGFKETIEVLKNNLPHVDLYAPLLPYHGRGLKEAKKFNNRVIESYVNSFIKDKAEQYDKIYVVASSYAGAILSKLLLEKGGNAPRKLEGSLREF